jgi:molybdopterin-containing oxidoreductase family membrane subunit
MVRPEVLSYLGRLSGGLLIAYVLLKSADTLYWLNRTALASGFHPSEFYSHRTYGTWILFGEIVFLGLMPALMLLSSRVRERTGLLVVAAALACCGVALNRFVLTIQTLALPTLPFDRLLSYIPSWQEMATFIAVVAYGVVVYSLSFRYLPLFPQERELNRV